MAEKANVPYGFIDMIQYGRAMAQEIYDQAVELYKTKGKKQ
jgi:cellobiose-specific phosphotransferase system component IIB